MSQTKYIVLHQIETDPPSVVSIRSHLRHAIKDLVNDVLKSDAYKFTEAEIKKVVKKDNSFFAGEGFDNWYIVEYAHLPV